MVDTSYQSKLETYANTHGLNVKFLGEIPETELAALYFSADVFIMTSVHYRNSIEGFGLVYLEAAAHELPIIAHKIGGVSRLCRRGKLLFFAVLQIVMPLPQRFGISSTILKYD